MPSVPKQLFAADDRLSRPGTSGLQLAPILGADGLGALGLLRSVYEGRKFKIG